MDLNANEAQLCRFGVALGQCLSRLGADMELLAVAGSLGDTMEIDEFSAMLAAWAAGGTYFGRVLCAVDRDPDPVH